MERVIFDTNGYRNLVKGLSFDEIDDVISELREKEKRNHIEASTSLVVVQELLAHVGSPYKGGLYTKSLNAMKAMYLHSFDSAGSRVLASPDSLVAQYIFNVTSNKKQTTALAFFEIVEGLSKSPDDITFQRFHDNLAKNRNFIRSAEQQYAQEFLDFLKSHDPTIEGWKVFENNPSEKRKLLDLIRSHEFSIALARLYCGAVFNYYSQEHPEMHIPNEEDWKIRGEKFVTNFPEFIALYKSVFENILNSDFNMFEKDRGNYWWDTLLMLNVGDHRIQNDKLYFVTNDNAILRTARINNGKNSIFTFEEYMEYLGD